MNLLRFFKITFITALISFAATSCNNLDKNNGPSWISSYATVLLSTENPDVVVPTGASFYFVADGDNSTILYPTNPEIVTSDIKNNQRLLLTFTKETPAQEAKTSTDESLLVKIVAMSGVITKEVLQTSKIDTLGSNVTEPLEVWYSGGVHGAKSFVTIYFSCHAAQYGEKQFVYLVEDLKDKNPIDEEGYYSLSFRVTGKTNGYYDHRSKGIISVPLAEKYLKENIKGLKISFIEDMTNPEDVIIKHYPYESEDESE